MANLLFRCAIVFLLFCFFSFIWAFGHIVVSVIGMMIVIANHKQQTNAYTFWVAIITLVTFPIGMSYFVVTQISK
jgi:hypothetical protein